MKHRFVVLACLLAMPLVARGAERDADDFPPIPPTVPEEWIPQMAKVLPVGQTLSQTIVADLDGDGRPEWITISEPDSRIGQIWVHIFEPAEGRTPPKRIWRQPLYGDGFTVARGFITEVRPFPNVLVVVSSEPFHTGDSRFRVQMIGWNREAFRQMVPEDAVFRSQGGFRIEEAVEPHSGDSLLVWTYVREQGELLYDYHHYEYFRFHFDGFRFAVQQERDTTKRKHPNPESAGREAGATGPDLRRRIDFIAEIP